MENLKKFVNLSVINVILFLFLTGNIFYNFKVVDNASKMTISASQITTDKIKVLQSLYILKAKYERAIAEKSVLSDALKIERDKVILLIADLKKSTCHATAFDTMKKRCLALQLKMKSVMIEYESIKLQNNRLLVERDSIRTMNNSALVINEVLNTQNGELNKIVAKAQKLSVLNLKSIAVKLKSSGKQVDTEKASRADVLKISFTIAENTIASAGDKTYNIQVLDANNNVLGEKKIESYGKKRLTYSFIKTVNYDNKSVTVIEDLPVKDIESGTYYVNVFDNGELVSKTSFDLK